jgi:hypothetical protein
MCSAVRTTWTSRWAVGGASKRRHESCPEIKIRYVRPRPRAKKKKGAVCIMSVSGKPFRKESSIMERHHQPLSPLLGLRHPLRAATADTSAPATTGITATTNLPPLRPPLSHRRPHIPMWTQTIMIMINDMCRRNLDRHRRNESRHIRTRLGVGGGGNGGPLGNRNRGRRWRLSGRKSLSEVPRNELLQQRRASHDVYPTCFLVSCWHRSESSIICPVNTTVVAMCHPWRYWRRAATGLLQGQAQTTLVMVSVPCLLSGCKLENAQQHTTRRN